MQDLRRSHLFLGSRAILVLRDHKLCRHRHGLGHLTKVWSLLADHGFSLVLVNTHSVVVLPFQCLLFKFLLFQDPLLELLFSGDPLLLGQRSLLLEEHLLSSGHVGIVVVKTRQLLRPLALGIP